jgi:hypothetical protein
MATALDLRARRRHGYGAQAELPPLEQLLVSGGDDRIAVAADTAANKYGCPPRPDPDLIAFGSSTASVISAPAFAATQALRVRLHQAAAFEAPAVTYARELRHLRGELLALCGVDDLAGLEVVFAASGTDLHLIAGRLLAGDTARPGLAVMVDGVETGGCVPAALAGRHFGRRAALGGAVREGAAVTAGAVLEVAAVALRHDDGTPRAAAAVDAEVTALVSAAAALGRRVLLTLVDVSKSGMIAPSPACALALQRRWPETVQVVVDACQFRLAPATLRGYLAQGFMVALTGSKFVGGPTFSGALLVPAAPARRLRGRLLPRALRDYSPRADWPAHWVAAGSLPDGANFGLLLRWRAALEELRAFRAVPAMRVEAFLNTFGRVIHTRLRDDPAFEPLRVPRLERPGIAVDGGWDRLQTIFPFILCRRDGRGKPLPLSPDQTLRIYRLLQDDLSAYPGMASAVGNDANAASRYQLGQPVACGRRDGVAVSALRLCAGARTIVAANGEEGVRRVCEQALGALDKAALLVKADR